MWIENEFYRKPIGRCVMWEVTLADGRRIIHVSTDHPDIYALARQAEESSDRDLMRAVTNAANRETA